MKIQSHKGNYTVEFNDACIERFSKYDLDKTLKTSLDYPEDYEFIKYVFAELHHPGTYF